MCLRFLAGNDLAFDRRGGPLFASAARWTRRWPFRWLNRGHVHHVHRAGAMTIEGRPCEVWFVTMPAHWALADVLEERPFARLIVDYHADVLGLVHPNDVTPAGREASRYTGAEGWRWWMHPDRIEALTRGLVAADVITTPWVECVAPLSRRFGRPVILLPDTHPRQWRAFQKVWDGEVMPTVVRARRERHGDG